MNYFISVNKQVRRRGGGYLNSHAAEWRMEWGKDHGKRLV